MKRAVREHWKDFAAILGLVLISGVVSVYILTNQRFQFPFVQEKPFQLNVELENAQAVTAGQGQTVEVAGVKVGRIGKIKLRDGRAIVGLDMFPEYKDLVKEDASALLRPRTGLKDMFVQLDPGSKTAKVAEEGYTIPARRTMTDVDLEEVLSSLDRDTREHLQLLLDGAAEGLKGRGPDLAELFRRFGPTMRDLRRVNQEVAKEREALKDAIHGLSLLTEELAGKDDELAGLVDSSAAVFEAFASEDRNVSATVRKLPSALKTTTETLRQVERFANQLGPAATRLEPAFVALEDANQALRPFARAVTPILRDEIRPFVREAQPLVEDLRPAAIGLGAASGDLTTVFTRLNHLFNLAAFNPNGREAPDKEGREEGYLFWYAWVTHIAGNLVNIDDANGPLRPVFLTGTCSTLVSILNDNPELEFLQGLSPVLAEQCNNPDTRSQKPELVKRAIERERKAEARREGSNG